MKIAFRTDASSDIGTGHVVRCATLAAALRKQGAKAVFISREEAGHLCDWLEQRGHEVRRIVSSPANQQEDADRTLNALDGEYFDWLVVDHYGLGREWEHLMRPSFGRRFVIDDIGRPHDCELLLDQNILDDDEAYLNQVPTTCRRLIGPRYALLRPEFALMRGMGSEPTSPVRHVLINFGGADPEDETTKAIEGFLLASPPLVRATVILGRSNPHRKALTLKYQGNPRLSILDYCDDMAELMASCDLAIGAGGISAWERACLGLPAIVTAIASNQYPIAKKFALHGGQIFMGSCPTQIEYADTLKMLSANRWLRESCSRIGRQFVDGRGCQRVAAILLPGSLSLRPAQLSDADNLLEWRNADINRLASFDPAPIPRERHQAWLCSILDNPQRALLIGEEQGIPVGVLRYDFTDSSTEVSIYLVPGFHGHGQGEQLLRAGTRWLQENRTKTLNVRARIKADNGRSQAAFRAAGYVPESTDFVLTLTSNAIS